MARHTDCQTEVMLQTFISGNMPGIVIVSRIGSNTDAGKFFCQLYGIEA